MKVIDLRWLAMGAEVPVQETKLIGFYMKIIEIGHLDTPSVLHFIKQNHRWAYYFAMKTALGLFNDPEGNDPEIPSGWRILKTFVKHCSMSRDVASLDEQSAICHFILRCAATKHHRRLVLTLFVTAQTSFSAASVTNEIKASKQVVNRFEFKGGWWEKNHFRCARLCRA